MFKDAKIGDRVFDYTLQEWGEIISTTNLRPYTVLVSFKNNKVKSYTIQGTRDTNKLPTLFWDEVKPITPPEKPLPKLEIDTTVLVWSSNANYKYKRHFSHFDSKGNMHCFKSGTTSWSADGRTTEWKYWELAE